MTKAEYQLLKKLKDCRTLSPDTYKSLTQEEFKNAAIGLQRKGLANGIFVDQENGKCIQLSITDEGLIYKDNKFERYLTENRKWIITIIITILCALIAIL